ncbi:MAG: hypothetical protein ABIA78_00565 [archaeon]
MEDKKNYKWNGLLVDRENYVMLEESYLEQAQDDEESVMKKPSKLKRLMMTLWIK